MPIDTATITDLNNIDRLNAIVDHLKSIPPSKRAGIMEIVKRGLNRREKARLKYHWPLHARESQLPPMATGTPGSFSPDEASERLAQEPSGFAIR